MHTMWKGSVSFGLVNVPVRMFAATESKDIQFRYLHKVCSTPIQYTRTCPHCDRPVEWDEIVRGFEYEPNRFVIMDEDELKSVNQSRSQTIDILDFVELTDIDPVYYDKTYYLAPETSGVKAYRLLQAAMQETGKIAIAKTVLRNAETLACVRTYQHLLVVETLFWPDEVRATAELPNLTAIEAADVAQNELQMAVTLINQLAGTFTPEKYVDERRTALQALIERKVSEADVTEAQPAAARPDNIVDLMQALQESIRRTQTDASTATPRKRRARAASGSAAETGGSGEAPQRKPRKRTAAKSS
ncbi:Ku protein [Alicyclobacillus cycloheptanicus]|uniref:Non-homologous end joining protein Ku n=1 Tax=Alicyclobacillus cycloheptanicus TaxID=1457 RepID=A0ABT9XE51_9BACL|nr:Ku protein [Alicyclobacillus cycloheptanicus]MDQ0188573.1 DNA end-binding protein Ku [Alicyclobacillus cycloheptanicus]WDM01254.1 Ku protein [Alicyclobacillus cycloheptanicus]